VWWRLISGSSRAVEAVPQNLFCIPISQPMEAAMRKHRDFNDLPCFQHHA
jgi:hypothetical protein